MPHLFYMKLECFVIDFAAKFATKINYSAFFFNKHLHNSKIFTIFAVGFGGVGKYLLLFAIKSWNPIYAELLNSGVG